MFPREKKSTYKLVEAEIGGRLSRHNLQVIQLGPETHTEFSTFSLSSQRQVQDLHSRLVLNHPRGTSRQLHKCIVTHRSGQAVFDGNVKVNRLAQQTDAGQLSRSLLLAPGATVNVKPNLQIIADDVKCTHGAAISDLEEDQLFYFQARGIDALTARSALVFSFAADVFQSLGNDSLQKRLEGLVKSALASDGVVNPNVPVRQPIL
jgi:Fe-S cluster assembly protein SufD